MRIDITWKLFLAYVLGVFILIMLASCGTRKVAGSKDKEVIKDKSEETSTGNVKKEENTSEATKDSEINNDVEDNLKETITELYNENGSLKSRIKTLEKTKVDKSTSKQKESVKTAKNTIDSTFTNTHYKDIYITRKHTQKDVVADKSVIGNFSIWGILGITVIVAGAVFLYFYLRNK